MTLRSVVPHQSILQARPKIALTTFLPLTARKRSGARPSPSGPLGARSPQPHRVRERLVSQRTGIINQIRAFLLERGIAVRQGLRFLRAELPRILATPSDVLSPGMTRIIEDLAADWRRLDERIERLSSNIE